MAIITLTTDFGEKDHFAGAIKGAIYSELPDVRIVDISHSVAPFNVPEAAYIIQNAYDSFPKGTIHIIGIDSELNDENKHIAIKLDDHYFICANNGIMSMICSEISPEKIVEINIHDKIHTSFPVLDVFVKAACHVARGGTLEVIGKNIDKIKPIKNIMPYVNDEKTQIIGSIIYVDDKYRARENQIGNTEGRTLGRTHMSACANGLSRPAATLSHAQANDPQGGDGRQDGLGGLSVHPVRPSLGAC